MHEVGQTGIVLDAGIHHPGHSNNFSIQEPPYFDCMPVPIGRSSGFELRVHPGPAARGRSVAFSSLPSSGTPLSTIILIYDFVPPAPCARALVLVYRAALAQTYLSV